MTDKLYYKAHRYLTHFEVARVDDGYVVWTPHSITGKPIYTLYSKNHEPLGRLDPNRSWAQEIIANHTDESVGRESSGETRIETNR